MNSIPVTRSPCELVECYNLIVHPRDQEGDYLVTCPAFPGLSAFAETPEAAIVEARTVLQDFIEIYLEEGRPLPESDLSKPYSGKLNLRMPKSLHAALARVADAEGVSLNTLIITALSRLRSEP